MTTATTKTTTITTNANFNASQPQPADKSSTTPSTTPSATATPKPSATQVQLSQDRASNIGWFFIKSYYDFFISKLDEIHKIYHPHASINHDAFPGTKNDKSDSGASNDNVKDVLPIAYKAKGTDAIKETFSKHLSLRKNNRIVITSACFEVSLEKNIIIVVFGEWSSNDEPYKQFTQTFVLVPGKTDNTYDVANDILKFVSVNGYKEKHEQKRNKK